MGKVLLCVGEYAEKPYYLEKIERNVYCIEELCYTFRENAFLLDESILDRRLAEWIEEQCKLPDLARELYGYINARCSVSVFVTVILEYAAYTEEEEIADIRQLLMNNAGRTDWEKRKAHADYMAQNGRAGLAVAEYDAILSSLTGEMEWLRPQLCHNKGAALAKLFLYKEAAEWFERAWQLGSGESRLCRLLAKRLGMKEQEYISYIADHPEEYELSLEAEKKLEQSRRQWDRSEQGERFLQLMCCKEDNRMPDYYKEAEELVRKLKEEYRRMAV